MDLTQRKYINNNKDLLKFDKGLTPFQQRLQANGATALTSTVGFVGNLANAGSYNKTVDDLNTQAGQSSMSTGGYGYQAQNTADTSKEMSEVSAQNTANTIGMVGSGASAGAAIGSLAGPVGGLIGGAVGAVGGLIGGIFGGKSRARKAKEALLRQQREAAIQTEFNRARANTDRLSDKYAEENGFDATQYLNSGFASGKQPVYSPFGKVNAKADSKVSKGEVAIDTLTGSRYRIPTGPNDTALFAGGKSPYTAIITNKYGLSDIAMEDPETAIALQGMLKENGMLGRNKQGYKCGKMPKYKYGDQPWGYKDPFITQKMKELGIPDPTETIPFSIPNEPVTPASISGIRPDEQPRIGGGPTGQIYTNKIPTTIGGVYPASIPEYSLKFKEPSLTVDVPSVKNDDVNSKKSKKSWDWLPNAISSGATSLAGLGQYLSAKGQSVYKPNSYVPNPNKGKAMNILAGLRPNELPIINSLTDAQGRAYYGLDNAGGVSAAQKYLARVGTARNTQRGIYEALAGLQDRYNQMRSQYANSLLSSGAQEAANMMNANKYDTDIYMRGHAARQQGMQTGIQNMIAGLQQGIANADKLNRFNKMYSLYATA